MRLSPFTPLNDVIFPRLAACALILSVGLFAPQLRSAPDAPIASTPPLAAFAHVGSDLSPDPAIRFGTLPNGVRYALLHNNEPKNRASLRLHIGAGSFNETEAQRGVAHFLEHMAFNGSEHYAAGTLVEFFQRMGMSFGGDTNAFTSFDQTVYMLELPKTDAPTLAEGLRVFADYAGGLLLIYLSLRLFSTSILLFLPIFQSYSSRLLKTDPKRRTIHFLRLGINVDRLGAEMI